MVRNHYDAATLAGRPGFEQLQAQTFELCEFLVDVLKVDRGSTGASRTGSACTKAATACASCGWRAAASDRSRPSTRSGTLLEGLRGIALVELSRPDECCGFGGTFAVDRGGGVAA